MKLLGVPLLIWGVLCLVLAAVWVKVWPAHLAGTHSGFRFLVLRWFHALTWFLLALAAFTAHFKFPESGVKLLALSALLVYVVFMGTLITRR